MTSTKYSISAASRLTGKSRTTLTKHIRQGKLSCELDDTGAKLVDVSELMRVYGDDFNLDVEEGVSPSQSAASKALPRAEQGVQQTLHSVQLQLDLLTKERERERQQYQQQVEHLQSVLKQVNDAHNKAMLLLEHRTAGGGDWEKKLQALEEKLANREDTDRNEREQLKSAAKQDALKAIKDKPWWRLVGAKSL